MNEQIKTKWVDALRSGDYEQTKHSLHEQDERDNHSYCCLGVLCDLAVKTGVVVSAKFDSLAGEWQYDGSAAVLPNSIVKWAELDDACPSVYDTNPDESQSQTLTVLNDSGISFTHIADLIEASL